MNGTSILDVLFPTIHVPKKRRTVIQLTDDADEEDKDIARVYEPPLPTSIQGMVYEEICRYPAGASLNDITIRLGLTRPQVKNALRHLSEHRLIRNTDKQKGIWIDIRGTSNETTRSNCAGP